MKRHGMNILTSNCPKQFEGSLNSYKDGALYTKYLRIVLNKIFGHNFGFIKLIDHRKKGNRFNKVEVKKLGQKKIYQSHEDMIKWRPT